MATQIQVPYPVFFDNTGKPLEGGYVYIGVSGLNPISNWQTAYWDSALTIPADRKNIRTSGGYIVYNGAPSRLYVPADYSITVTDKNKRVIYTRLVNTVDNADLYMTTPRGTITRSARIPPSYNFDLILESGYYSWTNAGTTNYPSGCAAADFYGLDVLAGVDGAGIIYQKVVDFTLTLNTERYVFERKSLDNGVTWSAWALVGTDTIVVSGPATPYAITSKHPKTTILVTTGAGTFVVGLPSAATRVGNTITIVKLDSAAGVIQIEPAGGDIIANAGNTAIYVGQQYRNVTLQSSAAGVWVIVGGDWQPYQAVDTIGTHLALGRLHHFALNNTTDRTVFSSTSLVTPLWLGPYAVSGSFGVPSGAKAIRIKIIIDFSHALAGGGVRLYFSDNNISSPDDITSHPCIREYISHTAAGSRIGTQIIDIPLNSGGSFYIRQVIQGTLTLLTLRGVAIGYYMGD